MLYALLGSENQSRLCEIDNNPDWGTDGVLKEFKGKAYCCKHYATGKIDNLLFVKGIISQTIFKMASDRFIFPGSFVYIIVYLTSHGRENIFTNSRN